MIFLTVGTQFPFDRLVRAIDILKGKGIIQDDIFAQVGNSSYQPINFKSVQVMDAEMFEKTLKESIAVISHSGMGAIEMALANEKKILVMPRLKKYGEVVNDHQFAIAKKFEADGYLLAAYHEDELEDKIIQLKYFIPQNRINTSSNVIKRVSYFLNSLENKNIYDLSAK